jgi:hypothetical protein
MRARWTIPGLATLLVVLALAAVPALAGDVSSDMEKAGKSIGKAAKEFGEAVASGSEKVGKSVAEATENGAKTAWFKTRDWTTHESKRVADATVRWWDDVIRDKETTRDRLRRENKELKAKTAEKKH